MAVGGLVGGNVGLGVLVTVGGTSVNVGVGGISVWVAVGSGVLVAVGGTGVGVLVGGRVGIGVLVGGTAVAVGAGVGADVQPVTNVMITITISDEDKQRTIMPSLANLSSIRAG